MGEQGGHQGQGTDFQGAGVPQGQVPQYQSQPQPEVPQQFPPQQGYAQPPYPQQGQAPQGMPPQQYQQQLTPQQPRPNVAAKVFKVSLLVLVLSVVLWFVACFLMGVVSWSSGAAPDSTSMSRATAIVGWLLGVVLAFDLPTIVVSGIVALVTRQK